MQRTQILLEEWQHQALKSLAARQGISLSEALRRIVSAHLESESGLRRRRLARIRAVGDDPESRGRDHDEHLYSVEQERR